MTTMKKPCDLSRIDGSRKLGSISDKELIGRIRKLSLKERETVLEILIHLIEIDRRRLYLPRGYSSLFEFCLKHLGFSESTAGRRISVARCMGKFPRAYRALASGKVNLTNLAMITRIMTTENVKGLLSAIAGAPRKEVELLVSRHMPESVIRDRVRPVYVRTEIVLSDAGSAENIEVRSTKSLDRRAAATPTGGSGKSPNSSDTFSCRAVPENGGGPAAERLIVLEERFELKFGVDPEFLEKLERVRSLLSTKHHERLEFEEFFEILMDEYIERHSPEGRAVRKTRREQRKADRERREADRERMKIGKEPGKTSRAAKTSRNAGIEKADTAAKGAGSSSGTSKKQKRQKHDTSRYIPRKIRDEVYARDRGRCAFVAPGGKRCGSTWDLQIDHIVPFAKGGDNSPSNLRLLCAKHNRLEAGRAFGEKHMEQFCAP